MLLSGREAVCRRQIESWLGDVGLGGNGLVLRRFVDDFLSSVSNLHTG